MGRGLGVRQSNSTFGNSITGEVVSVREATEKELTEGLHGEYVHSCGCGGCGGHGGCGDCEGGNCSEGEGECGCGCH